MLLLQYAKLLLINIKYKRSLTLIELNRNLLSCKTFI